MFKKKLPVIIFSSFLLLFFLLFPRISTKEMSGVPHLIISQDTIPVNGKSEFWLDSADFYYGLNGGNELIERLQKSPGSSISQNWALRPQQEFIELTNLSDKSLSIPRESEQWISLNNRIFSFDIYRSISERNFDGSKIWERDIPSALTCMDADSDRLVLGFIDGSIQVLNKKGHLIQHFTPGGSRVELIYGVSLSENSPFIAVISGLSPQRFIVLEQKNSDYRPVFHKNLQSQYRRPITLDYEEKGGFFYYETPEGVELYDPINHRISVYSFEGQLQKVLYHESLGIPMILSKDKGFYYLNSFIENQIFYHNRYHANFSDISEVNDTFYWIVENEVFLVDWSRQ